MTIQVIILFVTHLVLPAIFIVWFYNGKYTSKFDWLIQFSLTGAFIIYIFLSGRWDWISYYLRFVIVGIFSYVSYVSYRTMKDVPFYIKKDIKSWVSTGINVVAISIFIIYNIFSISGYFYNEEPIELSFPLKKGVYYVGHGGTTPVINYHNINHSQKYALDIVKLNIFGTRAKGVYPNELNKYQIYGDTIYSPCNGVVIDVENNLADLNPPKRDTLSFQRNRKNIAGNRVVIKCDSIIILIAHMMKKSIIVQKGDTVKTGQVIGRVGNSGNTSEPHLHIHAEREGKEKSILEGDGIPIVFDGRFLVRNSLVF